MFLYTLVYAFFANWHAQFLPISALDVLLVKYVGIGLLLLALFWTLIAQKHMKNSWRIGIDNEIPTELISNGLFSYSRNPIFFGMILSLLGLFLVTPNALTALFLILCYMLIQIQIRLEEEFLTKTHGQKYLDYKQKVRRFI
jgi:protein-S-isoprenylcysteine O-methyltransferase Ste14